MDFENSKIGNKHKKIVHGKDLISRETPGLSASSYINVSSLGLSANFLSIGYLKSECSKLIFSVYFLNLMLIRLSPVLISIYYIEGVDGIMNPQY